MRKPTKTIVPDVLYHYCPLNSFFGIVMNKNLRLSFSKYSNDPSESQIGVLVLKEIFQQSKNELEKQFIEEAIKYHEQTKNRIVFNYPYVLCLSEKPEDLNQWRIYADNGRGMMFSIYSSIFKAKNVFPINPSIPIYKQIQPNNNILYLDNCIYNIKEQKEIFKIIIDQSLPSITKDFSLKIAVAHFSIYLRFIAAFFKHDSFKAEKEWRLVCFPQHQKVGTDGKYNFKVNYRNKKSVIIPYIELPIKSPYKKPIFSSLYLGSNVINSEDEILKFIMDNEFFFKTLKRSTIIIQEIN
jgi:hypothetical protein